MGIRTLIEINHDRAHRLGDEFLQQLGYYLASASAETAKDLEAFGIKVIGMRHHSGNFILDGKPDGFPVRYLTRVPTRADP